MTLFSNRDSNKSETFEDVRENTSTSEEDQLNSQIGQMEKEITDLYADIGQEYYESRGDDPLSEHMESCFRDIEERKEKIQECNDKIRTIKGITTCEHCGADILVTDTFCGTCGARIISEITMSPVGGTCPNCGQKVNPGQMFCSTCGAKINITEPDGEEEVLTEKTVIFDTSDGDAVVEETTTDKSKDENKRYCKNCGEEIQEGMQFCMYCGKPVEDSPVSDGFPDDTNDIPESSSEEPKTYCSNCGAILEPGDAFCIKCGHKVEE